MKIDQSLGKYEASLKYTPVILDGKDVLLSWKSGGFLRALPVGDPECFESNVSYNEIYENVDIEALKIIVTATLPNNFRYFAKLSDTEDSITLPLVREPDGTYYSTKFIALERYNLAAKYFYGVRVLHFNGGYIATQIEKMSPL